MTSKPAPRSRATSTPAKSGGPEGAPPRWQPRFGLGAMLLVMLVCSVMSSAGYYLVRGNLARSGQTSAGGHHLQLAFLLITLAAPLVLAVVISVALQIGRYLARRRR